MELVVKNFDELTLRELYELLRARSEIFVVEQSCIYQDIDRIDYDSIHVFLKGENDEVLACLRLYYIDEENKIVKLGRVISITHGIGLGGKILKEGVRVAKERMNPREIIIHAQCYAIGYYEKEGFRVCSEEFLEDDIPHVKMILKFE